LAGFLLKNGKLSVAKPDNSGYTRQPITISQNNVASISIQSLVANTFIGPKPKGYVIDHIDRIRCNNRVTNIRYVTMSENSKNRTYAEHKTKRVPIEQYDPVTNLTIQTYTSCGEAALIHNIKSHTIYAVVRGNQRSHKGMHFRFRSESLKNLEGEEWRIVTVDDGVIINVSNRGRVRSESTRHWTISYGGTSAGGYKIVKRNGKHYRMNRLVLEAFKPIENSQNYVASHIDNDPQNNDISNLEWTTHQENFKRTMPLRKRVHVDNNPRSIQVDQLDDNGNVITTYRDGVMAANAMKRNKVGIYTAAKSPMKRRCAGFYWRKTPCVDISSPPAKRQRAD